MRAHGSCAAGAPRNRPPLGHNERAPDDLSFGRWVSSVHGAAAGKERIDASNENSRKVGGPVGAPAMASRIPNRPGARSRARRNQAGRFRARPGGFGNPGRSYGRKAQTLPVADASTFWKVVRIGMAALGLSSHQSPPAAVRMLTGRHAPSFRAGLTLLGRWLSLRKNRMLVGTEAAAATRWRDAGR